MKANNILNFHQNPIKQKTYLGHLIQLHCISCFALLKHRREIKRLYLPLISPVLSDTKNMLFSCWKYNRERPQCPELQTITSLSLGNTPWIAFLTSSREETATPFGTLTPYLPINSAPWFQQMHPIKFFFFF